MRNLVVRTEKLNKKYGRRQAVRNLTLEVEPGEIYGVLGPKGSGKSTLIHLLIDLVHPTSGNALVLGMDSQRQGVQIRKKTGFLPVKLNTNGSQTGMQYIQTLAKLHPVDEITLAYSLADRLDLDMNKPIRDYTVCDRKKLGLIQAMISKPELLLLDEPTVDLDRKSQNVFYQLINEVRSEGRTVIFTSDCLTEMERVCDRVAVLYQGELIAVERGVQLRARALRVIEMRFASAVNKELFAGMTNLNDLVLEDNKVRCIVKGDPDALIKLASQYRVMDIISQQPTLEEVYQTYYGIGAYHH